MAKISINIKDGTVEKTPGSPVIVGIDLGTTHSLVAHINNGVPQTIADYEGKTSLVPSIIHISQDGQVLVGEQAKPFLLKAPGRTLYSIKRLMGKSYKDIAHHESSFSYKIIDDDKDALVKIQIDDRFYTPIELSAEILKKLKELAETHLEGPIEKAVITVPAYFNDTQRQATRDAGKLAGLEVLRIINEPTAAALAYDIGTNRQDHVRLAVYDLGGGTFDISILEIHDGVFEVLATNGDTYLGGDDMDKVIIDYWKTTYAGKLTPASGTHSFEQLLRLTAEKAKKALSFDEKFKTLIGDVEIEIDRNTFNRLIEPLIDRTILSCKQCLHDSKLALNEIDQVILVGGSTRVPLVKERVAEFFEKPVNDTIDPDQTVALGAAVQADILAGNRKDMLLLDITPLSLGIETIGGLMDTIIPRNTKVPTRAGRQYTTSVDGQKNLRISVFQGERELVEDNRKLGEFILQNIPPMAAGIPKIDIQFIIDADGILKVRAREMRSNVETEVQIHSQYGISEEEMARMLQASIQNAKDDLARRALIEARTEAKNILLHSQKFIDQNGSWLNKGDLQSLRMHMADLEEAVGTEDKDLINLRMEDLNAFSRPLAEEAMDRHVSSALRGKNM